jgi:hypothetical protein
VIGSGTETACAKSLLIALADGFAQTYSNPKLIAIAVPSRCLSQALLTTGHQLVCKHL